MKHIEKTVLTGLTCAGMLFMSGCSSDTFTEATTEDVSQQQSSPTGALEDETIGIVIPGDSNLRINYTDPSYEFVATPDFILQQWNGMKQCLQVEVPDGYILVERDVVPPEDATHVLEIPGKAFASALDREFDVFIQIRVDDFSEESDDRGYHFRQIIGPYMWRYNELNARSYDPNCAAFVVQ